MKVSFVLPVGIPDKHGNVLVKSALDEAIPESWRKVGEICGMPIYEADLMPDGALAILSDKDVAMNSMSTGKITKWPLLEISVL